MKYYIKERINPQTGIYYVPQGQLTASRAREIENGSNYGSNIMWSYDTEEEYKATIESLKIAGARVH